VRALAVVAALAAALLALPAAPAAAHPVAHGDAPRIVNVRPAPGEVVAAGELVVAALAIGNLPIERHALRIDGQAVTTTSTGGDHATIGAVADLAPGLHTAELTVGSAAGEVTRSWRFRADGTSVERLSGTGRLETAAAISRDLYPEEGTATAGVLARADDFPDALAGGPLALALDAPLLLSGRDGLSPVTASELRRALAPGATVHLLGGTSALGAQVVADIEALGFAVDRIAGPSRFATAAAIARRMPGAATAVVTSGERFADALAVSAPAARDGLPILLTSAGSLPEDTRSVLTERGVTDVVIVGGPGAVSAEVETELRELNARVERVSGPTRFATAAAVAGRFYDRPGLIAIASGLRFPDALAGGRHAAGIGAPLVLVDTGRVFEPQAEQIGELQPQTAVLYGGTAAVGDAVIGDLRRAQVSLDGPVLLSMAPSDARVPTLDEVVLTFDRDVLLPASDVHVTIAGDEAPGVLRHGEFASELVFALSTVPSTVQPRVPYEVDVTISASDARTVRAEARRLTLVQPPATLSRGDTGPEVADLQRRLRDAGFWLGTVDGAYGTLTHQAVMALQKTHGLGRDGVYGQQTRALLESGPPRPVSRSGPGSGRFYEIDLDRQILLMVVDGRVDWVFNTSTGHGRVYEFNGQTFRATTTTGRHRVVRQIDGLREAERGSLWRPKYYDNARGIAIHGSTSVPGTPESSGCIRVTYAAMDFIWSQDPGLGAGVWVYPEGHYG
jgi:putative cell wall-binding protein